MRCRLRLSEFLRVHSERILLAWDEFASTMPHEGKPLDRKALRDHAGQILREIADDLEAPQTAAQQIAKSRGEGDRDQADGDTAAETHADTRIVAGFGMEAMLTEYRALRATVLRMWAEERGSRSGVDEMQQQTRFNEAIDQAITESVARYTDQIHRTNNLFMGMLGHDIRNPLGTIRLSAELMMRTGKLSEDIARPIVDAAKRIQEMVELIVDFSRAQSDGLMPISVRSTPLADIFENEVKEARLRHPATPMTLMCAAADTQGEWDEGRLGQLLSNLLENAVLYGTPEAPVTVLVTAEPSYVGFSVHNEGKAISATGRERIFEPRKRGTDAEARKSPNGVGLGLYMCREIVRAHNGTLAVRSIESEGTTFHARLPRRQPVSAG
jgi:signal transduction histidine kinase